MSQFSGPGKDAAGDAPVESTEGRSSAPAARLVCLKPDKIDGAPTEFAIALEDGREHVVGRGEQCDARVTSTDLSREHARLIAGIGMWGVEDLGSTNGVYLNRRKVTAAWLKDGDEIRFGAVPFRFQVVGGEPKRAAEPREKPSGDSTLKIVQPPPPGPFQDGRRVAVIGGAGGVVAIALGAFLFAPGEAPSPPQPPPTAQAAVTVARPPPPPVATIRLAGYSEIADHKTGELALFRFNGNDRVLILDFPSLLEQGQAFNRIYTLVEKKGGPRDRVVTSDELQAQIAAAGSTIDTYTFGHDYRAEDLAKFFNLAARGGIILNPQEERLRLLFEGHGVIETRDGRYRAGDPARAVISVPQEQADDPATPHSEQVEAAIRRTILRHELSHGEFFTNDAYRDFCFRFWSEVMTEAERQVFVDFLAEQGYEPSDHALMVNETQAYLMHTPDERAFNAALLGVDPAWIDGLRRRFLAGNPPSSLFAEP